MRLLRYSRFLIREDISKYDISSLRYCTIGRRSPQPESIRGVLPHHGNQTHGRIRTNRNHPHHSHLSLDRTQTGIDGRTQPAIRRRPAYPRRPIAETVNKANRYRTDKGKPTGLFKEYYRDEAKTHEAYHDNIYYTGDVAWRDEDGYFWL